MFHHRQCSHKQLIVCISLNRAKKLKIWQSKHKKMCPCTATILNYQPNIFFNLYSPILTFSVLEVVSAEFKFVYWMSESEITDMIWHENSYNLMLLSEDEFVTVYPKKYAHSFVVLCFVVVTQSVIMNSHEVFIHMHQGCFAGTGAVVKLPQCQWSKPDGYGKISQCITTTKHSKAKTVCIFLGIYCMFSMSSVEFYMPVCIAESCFLLRKLCRRTKNWHNKQTMSALLALFNYLFKKWKEEDGGYVK